MRGSGSKGTSTARMANLKSVNASKVKLFIKVVSTWE